MSSSLIADSARAQTLKASGQVERAIALYRKIFAKFPEEPVAAHNLAAALCDAGYWAEGDRMLRIAMAMGLDRPETWLVLARSQQALGYLDDAERCYGEVLRRRSMAEAHRELLQLRWMRSGDIVWALGSLEAAVRDAPQTLELKVIKAQALMEAGEGRAALALLLAAAQASPHDGDLAINVGQAALMEGDLSTAIAHARVARALRPDSPGAHSVLIEALLAAGQARDASTAAAEFHRLAPLNQHAIALQATAWRMLGDPRYEALFDYESFLCVTDLDAPPGWPSLSAYLADLALALNEAHHFRAHPFAQSIRNGSQAADVLSMDHPAARALAAVLQRPVRSYIEALGSGVDPMRTRTSGAFKVQGMWSVRLRAGGRHINHVHPNGWLSSVCYVQVPNSTGREGWLKLGEPPESIGCGLSPEYFVEPAPGRLVLFPSYMWHGTTPFTGAGARLTFAFDIVPA